MSKVEIKKPTFETRDIYLGSALKINGFKLVDLKRDQKGYGIFVFEDRENRLEIVRAYYSGDLKGSLKAFSNAWGDLKSLVTETRH